MGCLDNVIKLSRTQCECFEQNQSPEIDINEGQAEVYLDELEGINLNLIQSVEDCEQGSLWDLMVKARANAELAFKADMLSCMEANYVQKRANYSGLIGETTHNSTLNLGTTYGGSVWIPNRVVGGKAKISRIGLILNAAVSVQVRVYNNDENYDTPIDSYTFTTNANAATYAVLSTPLELPLWSPNVENLEYYFVYTISGFNPRNNKIKCVPCSGGRKIPAWQNWVRAYGIKGSTTAYEKFTRTDELNGVLIDAEFTCNASRSICSDEYPLDFENSGRAMQIAFAIRFKAGAILMDNILSSPQINRFTMLDREALYGKRNYYRKTYEDWISYLCSNTEAINNDCWACRQSDLMKKGSILK